MVCIRCKMLVKEELHKLGLRHAVVELGEVEIFQDVLPEQRRSFNQALLRWGLELMDDKKSILIEKIKNIIIELIHRTDEPLKINLSNYLSDRLNHDYTYLANLFSQVEGITIEHFIIFHKIEKVKELLVYNELSLTQISYLLHYSSVSHLSKQFKKITGLTPSHFKQLKNYRRSGLDNLL